MSRKTKELLLLVLLTMLLAWWNPGELERVWKPTAFFSFAFFYAIPAAVLTVILSNIYHRAKGAKGDFD